MSRYFLNTQEGIILINDVGEDELTIPGKSVVDIEAIENLKSSYQWNKLIRKKLLMEITDEQAEILLNDKFVIASDESETSPVRDSITIDLEEDLRANVHSHDLTEEEKIMHEVGLVDSADTEESVVEAADNNAIEESVELMDKKEFLNRILSEVGEEKVDTDTDTDPKTVATVAEVDADSGSTVAQKVPMKKMAKEVDTKFVVPNNSSDHRHDD